MKKCVYFPAKHCLFFIIPIFIFKSSIANVNEIFDRNGMQFVENKGQVVDMDNHLRPEVLYVGEGGNSKVYLRKGGWSFVLNKTEEPEGERDIFDEQPTIANKILKLHRVDVDFVGCNKTFKILDQSQVEGYCNFYLGHCPNGITNVKAYNKIVYENIYNKIDVIFYGNKQQGLKYDIVVKPGGNPNDIKIKYTGTTGIDIRESKLEIQNSLETVVESMPKVYQNVNGKITDVKCEYNIEEETILTFKLSNYSLNYNLIIDPWMSFCGGTLNDEGISVAVDFSGNSVYTGYTESSNFPASPGAFQTRLRSFNADAFVVKMDANGSRLWATYFGDSLGEWGRGVTFDNLGNVLVAGNTGSRYFPVGASAGNVVHQSTMGGLGDAFLLKLDAAGTRLWATYYGGLYGDIGTDVVTDGSDIYLYGETGSNNAISTNGVFQTALNGTPGTTTGRDIFVARFDANGNRVWASYAGSSDKEEASEICYDNLSGNIYVCGSTYSNTTNDFPVFSGHQMSYGGFQDAFLFKFNSVGQRVWATYYGGSSNEYGLGLAIDDVGNVILGGMTLSTNANAISSAGAYQLNFGGGGASDHDGFIVKFDATGTRLWGTYLGGNHADWVMDLDVDNNNNIFAYGEWEDDDKGNYPISPCALQTNQLTPGIPGFSLGNAEDLFIAKYDANGTQRCITILGGSDEDDMDYRRGGFAIKDYKIYITGSTRSNDFPVTPGAFQSVRGTGSDAFIGNVCINICEGKNLGLDLLANNTNVCPNVPVLFSPIISFSCDTLGYKYEWTFPGGTPASSLSANPSVSYNAAGIYAVKLKLITACREDSILKTAYINVQGASVQATIGSNITCNGLNDGSAVINPTGGTSPYTFLWNGGQTTAGVSGLSVGTYSCAVTDSNLCITTFTVSITEPQVLVLNSNIGPGILCNGDSTAVINTMVIGGTIPYHYNWSLPGLTGNSVSGLPAGNYSVTVSDSNNCVQTTTVNITEPLAIVVNPSSGDDTCAKALGVASVIASGGVGALSYLWSTGSSGANVTGLTQGIYSVTVTDANNCAKSTIVNINNTSGPVADAGNSVSIISGNIVTLSGTGGGLYTWFPSNTLSCASCSNPLANPTQTTTYTLVVTDANGCTAVDVVTINVEMGCGDVLIPTAFSPNADGENDLFSIYTDATCIKQMIFYIYNRWGEKIFEATRPEEKWDGYYRGKLQNTDVFTYHIYVETTDGQTINQKGNISLIR